MKAACNRGNHRVLKWGRVAPRSGTAQFPGQLAELRQLNTEKDAEIQALKARIAQLTEDAEKRDEMVLDARILLSHARRRAAEL